MTNETRHTVHYASLPGSVIVNESSLSGNPIMGIGSITKMFTGSAVMKLSESGVLRLDEKVVDIFPDHSAIKGLFNHGNREATIADLLQHTAGLPDVSPEYVRKTEADMSAPFDLDQAIAMNEKIFPEFGKVEYSNIGYMIIGEIINAKTGKDYTDVVREEIIDPLGLKDTGFYEDVATRPELVRPTFHRQDASIFKPAGAASSMFSTAADLDRFVRAFASGLNGEEGKHFFNDETLDFMRRGIIERKPPCCGAEPPEGNKVIEIGLGCEATGYGGYVAYFPDRGESRVTMVAANEVSGLDIRPLIENAADQTKAKAELAKLASAIATLSEGIAEGSEPAAPSGKVSRAKPQRGVG